MYDFIANDGSYAHRGVWHITENLKVEDKPAETSTREWKPGHTVTYIRPAHTIYTGDAICGQVKGLREGGLDWGRHSKDNTTITYRAKRANVLRDALNVPDQFIPGPLCSRCAKKAGIEV
jgi:hypothetical protein